jgi:hypothetical protein
MLNREMPKYSLQRYFYYKNADATVKCRICNKEIKKTTRKNDSLIQHLKEHKEYFKTYDSARRKKERCRGYDAQVESENDEENEGEEGSTASQSQPILIPS